jgi:two-component system, chemotaxis family, protein-glutamate methylesterase/glutaminase
MTKRINTEHIKRDVVVIGASAGGVASLVSLFEKLPCPLPGAIAVVLHRHPQKNVSLVRVLGRAAPLPVIEASDEGPFHSGTIYLAPGDAHLVLTEEGLRVHRGPKEHCTRPAIDPLFHSAAGVYGSRVVGVLLSGAGSDGVRGLIRIKAGDGLSVVQDPAEAMVPSMPTNALLHDHVDLVLPLTELASLLIPLMVGEQVACPAVSWH